MGYRYDQKSGQLLGLGALSVDIQPNTGEVYLNNIKLKKNYLNKKTEVKNIIPNKYDLNIRTDGFYDWQKTIEIENNKTVYVKEINLIQKNNSSILANEQITALGLSSDNNYLTYIANKNNQPALYLYNIQTKKTKQLLTLQPNIDYKINWAEKNNCLALQPTNNQVISLFCLNWEKTITLPATTVKMQWKNTDDDPEVYFQNEQKLYSLKLLTEQTATIAADDYVDWFFAGSQLWTLQINTTTDNLEIYQDTLGFKTLFKE